MTTATATYPARRFNPLPWLILAGLIAAFTVITGAQSHAAEHGSRAEWARNCLNNNPNVYWFNPITRQQARTCIEGDRAGIQIFRQLADGTKSEITAFRKLAAGIENYMIESGYIKVDWMAGGVLLPADIEKLLMEVTK